MSLSFSVVCEPGEAGTVRTAASFGCGFISAFALRSARSALRLASCAETAAILGLA